MTVYEVPLSKIPAQQINVQVGNSLLDIRLKILQNTDGIFADIKINEEDIILGAWCKSDVNLISPVINNHPDIEIKTVFFKSSRDIDIIRYEDLGDIVRLYYAI